MVQFGASSWNPTRYQVGSNTSAERTACRPTKDRQLHAEGLQAGLWRDGTEDLELLRGKIRVDVVHGCRLSGGFDIAVAEGGDSGALMK